MRQPSVIFQKFADFLRRNDCVYFQVRRQRTEAALFPKTSAYFYHTNRQRILEEDILDFLHSNNLKSHTPMTSPCLLFPREGGYIVRYATTNECYNEEFLSIKSLCHNERGGILSAHVARACT
jgi:hypothetical protein